MRLSVENISSEELIGLSQKIINISKPIIDRNDFLKSIRSAIKINIYNIERNKSDYACRYDECNDARYIAYRRFCEFVNKKLQVTEIDNVISAEFIKKHIDKFHISIDNDSNEYFDQLLTLLQERQSMVAIENINALSLYNEFRYNHYQVVKELNKQSPQINNSPQSISESKANLRRYCRFLVDSLAMINELNVVPELASLYISIENLVIENNSISKKRAYSKTMHNSI